MTERQLQNAILRQYATRKDIRLWRQNTGVGKFGDRVVRFGIPGQGDLSGILPDGRRLEIEVKSKTGRQSPEQYAFGQMIERFGGVYILARTLDDVTQRIEHELFMRGNPL